MAMPESDLRAGGTLVSPKNFPILWLFYNTEGLVFGFLLRTIWRVILQFPTVFSN
jgi:hypothetical protein